MSSASSELGIASVRPLTSKACGCTIYGIHSQVSLPAAALACL